MFLGGYLVGSLPTAYLAVRVRSGSDIRTQGSGNVGSLNTYVVTRSKALGIGVGLIDGMKGLLPVGIAALLGAPFWWLAALLFGTISGHIFTIWLRFRGGRGLATACGGLLLLSPPYVLAWCTIWLIWKRIGKEVLTANLLAIVLTPIVLFFVPGEALALVPIPDATPGSERLFALLVSLVLLLGHLNALKEIARDLFQPKRPSANS